MSVSPEHLPSADGYKPFIFRNGEQAFSIAELLNIAQKLPQEGIYFLMSEDFEKWLKYIGQNGFAEVAASARQSPYTPEPRLHHFVQTCLSILSSSHSKENTMSTQTRQVVYVQDYAPRQQSKLYELDLGTGKATLVGEIGTEIYDLAAVDADLYGLDKKDFSIRRTMQLIKIDKAWT